MYANMIHNSAIIILLFIIVASSEYYSSFHHLPVRNKRQQSTDTCPAPSIKNGKFVVLGHKYTQGTRIPNNAPVKFICNENYVLFPNTSVINCIDGSWTGSVPECKLSCPPLTSTSVDIKCTFNNNTVNCSNPVVEGTIAKCKCKEFYVSLNTYQFPTTKCTGRGWDKLLIECVPDCGEGISKGVPNIVNGMAAEFGDFPWHIALYRHESDKHIYQCGGSIVTPLIVISAAHCFTDPYGEKNSAELYHVGAGKYYSAYDARNDKLAQIRQVKEIHIPQYYKGFDTNYQADLAVVVIKTEFQLTSVVRPVCVDLNREFERDQLLSEARGTVVGWGYVDPNKPEISEDLKKLTVPFIEVSKCLTAVPPDFNRWVTSDKFCAGLRNGSSVCRGDSGGGLVFPWTVNNKLKYYLRGIVSVGPIEEKTCDSHHYGVYTLVTHYSDFVQNVIADNSEVKTQAYITSSYGSCRIPVLDNGKFLYLDEEYNVGYSIPNYSFLWIYCDENYILYPEMPYLLCVNTTWLIPVPTCKKTCPPLISSVANVSCSVDDKPLDCSGSVVEGTVAKISCKLGSTIFLKCGAGLWSESDPFKKCEQELTECTVANPAYCDTTALSSTVRPPLDTSSCPEPKIENGTYEVLGQNSGSYIPNYSVVTISCNKNYSLTPPTTEIFCIKGNWNTKVPKCKATCLPRISTSSVDITCTVDGIHVDCSKPSAEGTVAKSSCKRFYENNPILPTQSSVSVCISGFWDNPIIQCVPECGRVRNKNLPRTSDGKTTEISEFPWHVGIYIYNHQYMRYTYDCGGSIISPWFVITAAHCLATEIDGKQNSADNYYVGAGKSYSDFNSSEDHLAQIRQVAEIHIPPFFKGKLKLNQADLGVLKLKKSFELTNIVQPACLDWNREFEKEQLKYGAVGKIAGWGYHSDEPLKPFTAPYVETEACLNIIPRKYIRWITPDKFCAGYTNNGSGFSAGYGGSGLVFSWKVNNEEKYYLTGIVSGAPTGEDGKRDSKQLTAYTRISFYVSWIGTIISEIPMQD